MSKCNILVAYPYVTQNIIDRFNEAQGHVRWLIDCGAFTAWKVGRHIGLDEYCQFLDGLPFEPWRYFTLDVIGDAKGTAHNYKTMIDRGYKPVPIFTRGEDISVLHEFAQQSSLVGIGGLAGTSQSPSAYLKHLWTLLPNKSVHVLGFSNIEWLKYFKPYSCDSSSWESGARYGTMPVYMGFGRFDRLSRVDMEQKPHKRIMARIDQMGFDPYLLRKEENWRGDYSLSRWVGAMSYVMLMRDMERNIGVRYFMALAANRPDLIIDCWERATTGYWPASSKARRVAA